MDIEVTVDSSKRPKLCSFLLVYRIVICVSVEMNVSEMNVKITAWFTVTCAVLLCTARRAAQLTQQIRLRCSWKLKPTLEFAHHQNRV